jgi:Phosphotransferase system mannitol/fructose-specific IIA domain (Ntr-type)
MRQLGAQRCHPWVNAVVRKILCEVKELHPENSGQLPNLGLITMNRLASILPAAQVLVHVDATSKKRAFEEAGLLFESQQGLSRALITDSLFARERLGSTGLGHGVAIPHGRIKGLKAPMAAVFQLQNPIGFDAPDEQPVSLLIFLLVPEAATQKHLQILSEIAELLSDATLREKLKTCDNAAELHELIAHWHSAQQPA